MKSLVEKYRPQYLKDLVGQDDIVDSLTAFVKDPAPQAFIFEGGTGVGKTSAAFCLARELGCGLNDDGSFHEIGGFSQIASGEQTGDTVRAALRSLWLRPAKGSGWKVLAVNEADYMSQSAAQVWLDGLENLPDRTCVVFTTNKADKMPRRFQDRCEIYHFESGALLLSKDAQDLIGKVWRNEGCPGDPPKVSDLDLIDEAGDISFRRLLQKLGPKVRAGEISQKSAAKPQTNLDYVCQDAMITKDTTPSIKGTEMSDADRAKEFESRFSKPARSSDLAPCTVVSVEGGSVRVIAVRRSAWINKNGCESPHYPDYYVNFLCQRTDDLSYVEFVGQSGLDFQKQALGKSKKRRNVSAQKSVSFSESFRKEVSLLAT